MISRRAFMAGAAAVGTTASYPVWGSALSPTAEAAPATCELALKNASLPGTVRAYVTGHEQSTGNWVLLRADGSVYRPTSPRRRRPRCPSTAPSRSAPPARPRRS